MACLSCWHTQGLQLDFAPTAATGSTDDMVADCPNRIGTVDGSLVGDSRKDSQQVVHTAEFKVLKCKKKALGMRDMCRRATR